MTVDDKELEYSKIRDAMDLATKKLREKEEKEEKEKKEKKEAVKEQEKSQDQLNKEKKNKTFKWIAYGAVILIAVVIIIIIIYLIFSFSTSSTKNNISHAPLQPVIQQQPIQLAPKPYQLFPPQPVIQQPVIQQQPYQLFPPQQTTSLERSPQISSPSFNQSLSFPSNDSSFFNKFDESSSLAQQPIRRGGKWNKKK